MNLASRKQRLMFCLLAAREALERHNVYHAMLWLRDYHSMRTDVPASTKRRWKCGR